MKKSNQLWWIAILVALVIASCIPSTVVHLRKPVEAPVVLAVPNTPPIPVKKPIKVSPTRIASHEVQQHVSALCKTARLSVSKGQARVMTNADASILAAYCQSVTNSVDKSHRYAFR